MSELLKSSTAPIIVVIGSCSVDFTTYAPRLPMPGETLHGTKFVTSFGGKGANQCVASAKLGGNTYDSHLSYMIARAGDDQWGMKYKEHLEDLGVNVTYFHVTENVTTGIAQISVAENGENQIVIVAGANKLLGIPDVNASAELIKHADVLIGQLETPFETTLAAFKLNKGVKILNAAPARTDIQEILPYCTILCVNELEAAVISGMEVDIYSNIIQVLEKLLNMGCETVIITIGSKGAVYLSKRDRELYLKPIRVSCKSVEAVDTTGAGDAFVGALATFLVERKDLPMHQIIGAACEVASISVTKEGTQESYPTKINAFEKKYEFVML